MKIFWTDAGQHGKIRNQGYLVAAYNIIKQIESHGIEIEKYSSLMDEEFAGLNIGREIRHSDLSYSDYDIVINNVLPDIYNNTGKYSIGYTYWETNRAPSQWVPYMNNMDEIWTSSDFIKNAFIESGVNVPITAFKLGIDETIFRKIDPQIYGKFIFIHDGSPSTRKNTQIAVDAFLKVFGGNSDYHLIIKSIGPCTARIMDGQSIVCSLDKHPQITVIEDTITDQEVANLYAQANCMIYPTSGEGWGMIPFQAIAMGIPTICTNFSACEEYAHFSYPLDYDLTDKNMVGIFSDAGQWAMPKFDDLCDKMLYIANNYDEAKKKTSIGADYIHANMKWSDVGLEYYNRLCQISKK